MALWQVMACKHGSPLFGQYCGSDILGLLSSLVKGWGLSRVRSLYSHLLKTCLKGVHLFNISKALSLGLNNIFFNIIC